MKRLYTLIAVALLLLGVTSSAGVIEIPSAHASGMTLVIASGSTPAAGESPASYTLVDTLGVANGSIDLVGTAVASAHLASEAHDLTRIDFEIACEGGSCSGTIYAAVYESSVSGADDVPDDRLQLASGTLDASTLTTADTPYENFETIDFGTAYSLNTSDYVQIVIWVVDGVGDIEIGRASFGKIGYFERTGTPPGETNDAANWLETDTNGGIAIRTYKSNNEI